MRQVIVNNFLDKAFSTGLLGEFIGSFDLRVETNRNIWRID